MIELTQGQELTLTAVDGKPLNQVQMAVGWDHNPTAGFIASGAPPIDLDASAVQFAGGAFFDLAFFNNSTELGQQVIHHVDIHVRSSRRFFIIQQIFTIYQIA